MTEVVVVGSGGRVGAAVIAATPGARPTPNVPWRSPAEAAPRWDALARSLHELEDPVLVWCAGAGVVGAGAAQMALELAHLDEFLSAADRHGVSLAGLVLVSSAGAVHGGSTGAVDEATAPRPISVYGEGKLQQESRARDWGLKRSTPVSIARLSNVYGPVPHGTAPAGLVATVVVRTLRRQPVTLFMPLDTIRDYIYVDDVAARLAELAQDVHRGDGPDVALVVSGRPVTIGVLVAEVGRVLRRRPLVAMGIDEVAKQQPRQTVFRPRAQRAGWWTPTPLAVGIHRVATAAVSPR